MLYNRVDRKIRQYQINEPDHKQCQATDDSDCSNDSYHTPTKYVKTNPKKQKLQLCKKFMMNGFCPYYSRCKFAHGSHQLRKNNEANLRYKTKQCGTFFIQGQCSYGNRCNFLHQQKSNQNKPNFGIQFLKSYNQTESRLNSILR